MSGEFGTMWPRGAAGVAKLGIKWAPGHSLLCEEGDANGI